MEGFDELQDVEAGYNNNFLKIFFWLLKLSGGLTGKRFATTFFVTCHAVKKK